VQCRHAGRSHPENYGLTGRLHTKPGSEVIGQPYLVWPASCEVAGQQIGRDRVTVAGLARNERLSEEIEAEMDRFGCGV
jgi:hypothetical protein